MRYLVIIFCLFVSFSCFSDRKESKKDPETKKVNRNNNATNDGFSFGCQGSIDPELSDQSIPDCFDSLNKKNPIEHPLFSHVEYLHLQNPNTFIDSATFLIDSVRHQLPDFGPLKCFYSYQVDTDSVPLIPIEEEKLTVRAAGNLIFFDPITHHTKVLTVYFQASAAYAGICRYFYIDHRKKITIVEFEYDEESATAVKKYIVEVDKNGKLSVVNQKIFGASMEGKE